jgi:hypothetical protein
MCEKVEAKWKCAGFHVINKTRNVSIMFFTMLREKSICGLYVQ